MLTGSSTVAPLANEIARRFESEHPGLRIDVQTGGSSRGIADATRGTADIGMVSRALKDARDHAKLKATRIATDGIALIVHKTNPIRELSNEEIVQIFTGQLNNWKTLGGTDAPITVVNKAEGRATLELFLKFFQLKSPDIQADIIIGDNQQGVLTVASDPHAVAYVSIGTADYEVRNGAAIRLLPMGGVAATLENVRTGEFPLTRPLNLVTSEVAANPKSNETRLVRAFLEFASSSAVNDLVEAQFFVPVTD